MKTLHWPFLVLFVLGSLLGTTRKPRAVENRALVQVGVALVILGNDTVNAEVARTSQERSKGLMDREEVPDGTGMLFVFEREASRTFWMQDTFVSLDIAFLDSSMAIIDIQQMESGSGEVYDSAAPAKFALEVRKGWFAEHGIVEGLKAEIIFL
ncbi:MAG TPA: DUF192 domain-containing protein [Gemmatimonadetes bacterium]|jgi:uncharacterized membrane protein (UPF0127 family)|nr:DUF192 domain-containing protein [Gemmatimonadota bacterium]